jgi:hypothetical protein
MSAQTTITWQLDYKFAARHLYQGYWPKEQTKAPAMWAYKL